MSPRRKTDWGSLVAGVLFVALGLAFVVRGTGHAGFDAMWVLPVLAIGLGLVALTRALARSGRQNQ